MRPKLFTRVLSISADNDLRMHMERLSDAADDTGVDTDIYRDAVPHQSSRRRTEEEVVAKNLEVTADGPSIKKDPVNLPDHYKRFPIEPIRFIEENNLSPLEGKVVKYTLRAPYKNGLEDYDKALRCLWMKRERHRGNPDWWKRSDKLATLLMLDEEVA